MDELCLCIECAWTIAKNGRIKRRYLLLQHALGRYGYNWIVEGFSVGINFGVVALLYVIR